MKRPLPIAILAALLILVGAVGAISLAISDVRAEMLHPLAVAVRYFGMLIAGIGLWFSFKWGYFAYLGLWIIQIALFFFLYGGPALHAIGWFAWIGPLVVSAVVLPYWKRLR